MWCSCSNWHIGGEVGYGFGTSVGPGVDRSGCSGVGNGVGDVVGAGVGIGVGVEDGNGGGTGKGYGDVALVGNGVGCTGGPEKS